MRFLVVVAFAACGAKPPPTIATGSATPIDAALPTPAAPAPADAPGPARPPVAPSTRIGCDRLIDAARFTSVLREAAPLTVRDETMGDREATSACALVRGGTKPSEAEQRLLLKQRGRLGVMPGDVVCRVTTYCWTIEEPDRFEKRCTERGGRADDRTGGRACLRVTPMGADDVDSYLFLDEDTRCVLDVRGGPSNVDNDLIRSCAKTARETIVPARIAPT